MLETNDRRLPVGIQSFDVIRKEGYLYVDKTDIIWQLANTNKKYNYLSRPRRFGKSVLVDTLEAYFMGKKELFEGLKIMQMEKEWVKRPVIRLDMSRAGAEPDTLRSYLDITFDRLEEEYGITPKPTAQLSDRFAEATAELMHLEVRRKYWAYAPDEQLSMRELLREDYQGIRPAVGYPSMPDTSMNFLLDQLIDMKRIGIHLTESGAMRPHASVSGLMFAHPKAHYFDLGKIGDDQLRDYARRRHIPVELARRFLASRL